MKLSSQRVAVSTLSHRDIDDMYSLFARHYDRANRQRFETDLAAKDWVIRLAAPGQRTLCGFSTQKLVRVPHAEGDIHALFSGDTIVDPAYWQETELVRQWGRLAVELIGRVHPQPLYWYLISKGYKTYRFLPVFFQEFYPRHDQPTPPWAREIITRIGHELFGDRYDPQQGLVIADDSMDRLRPGVADVTPQRAADPHVRFFLRTNPDFQRGHELCCLAPLCVENFTRAGIRLLDPEHRPATANSRQNPSKVS